MGSLMFYAHAQMVVFSKHDQDVLFFFAHAYWVEGFMHAHSWVFCVHAHYHC